MVRADVVDSIVGILGVVLIVQGVPVFVRVHGLPVVAHRIRMSVRIAHPELGVSGSSQIDQTICVLASLVTYYSPRDGNVPPPPLEGDGTLAC